MTKTKAPWVHHEKEDVFHVMPAVFIADGTVREAGTKVTGRKHELVGEFWSLAIYVTAAQT